MKIGKTFYPKTRAEWRAWLKKNHKTTPEIWVVFYKRDSGKPRVPYNEAVEEALCFGWIDSTVKPYKKGSYCQRFSPRRPRSFLSELNKERIRQLIKAKLMTARGLEAIAHAFQEHKTKSREKWTIDPDILAALKKDPKVWRNFQRFPETYRRIRTGWIAATKMAEVRKTRLDNFLKMTALNKMFGTDAKTIGIGPSAHKRKARVR